jgi:hypothetical protein
LIDRLRFWAWRGTSVLIFLRVFAGKSVAKVDVLTGPERIANPNYPLNGEIIQLQERFSQIDRNIAADVFTKGTGLHPLMLCRLKNIKIRMDGNRNHRRPHIHIDYKEEYHSASYAIDTGERLAGNLETQYDRSVRGWIAECRPKLIELWYVMQAGRRPETILCELNGQDQPVQLL